MSVIETTNVVKAGQSGKEPEVEISLDGTAVAASEMAKVRLKAGVCM
jgi:hypothetical protein